MGDAHREDLHAAGRTDVGRGVDGADLDRVRHDAPDFHASSLRSRFEISLAPYASQPDARQP